MDDIVNTQQPPSNAEIAARLAHGIGAEVVDGLVVLPHTGANLRVELQPIERPGVVTLFVWATRPGWDRFFFDSASGQGQTTDAAIDQAVFNVGIHVVHLVDHLTGEAPSEQFATSWAGAEHRWSAWLGNLVSMGKNDALSFDGEPFWRLLRDGVVARLGNQKMTYVKVTAAWFGDNITAEVRINDVVSLELTTLLRVHIEATWPVQAGVFAKQFFLILQDDATRQPYPYAADDIKTALITAGRVFSDCRNGSRDFDEAAYFHRLVEAVGDVSLAEELRALVPELVLASVEDALPVDEKITIAAAGASHRIDINQLASYAHLVWALNQTWCREVPEATLRMWMASSALGNLVGQIKEKHIPPSSMRPISLTYNLASGYVLR